MFRHRAWYGLGTICLLHYRNIHIQLLFLGWHNIVRCFPDTPTLPWCRSLSRAVCSQSGAISLMCLRLKIDCIAVAVGSNMRTFCGRCGILDRLLCGLPCSGDGLLSVLRVP